MSLLTMKLGDDAEHAKIGWTWAKGAATLATAFGAPDQSDAYQVSVFDESGATPNVIFRATIPAGGQCDGAPCWRPTKKGFAFRSPSGVHAGVTQLQLQSGAAGRARLALKGAGSELALPQLQRHRPTSAGMSTAVVFLAHWPPWWRVP